MRLLANSPYSTQQCLVSLPQQCTQEIVQSIEIVYLPFVYQALLDNQMSFNKSMIDIFFFLHFQFGPFLFCRKPIRIRNIGETLI